MVRGGLIVRKELKRELDRAALIRLEESARSEDDFHFVTKNWDRLDANRERKERYHEQSVSQDMFDWDIFERRVGYEEDFLTLIYFCPCQMHNLVEDPDISKLVNEATDKQKEIFFPRVILNCPSKTVAHYYGMTDRNVRDLVKKMAEKVKQGLAEILRKRREEEEIKEIIMALAEERNLVGYITVELIDSNDKKT